MLLIDRLVHALHRVAVEGSVANFAARDFLEGSRQTIAEILDQLACGPASTADIEARARWQETRDRYLAEQRQKKRACETLPPR